MRNYKRKKSHQHICDGKIEQARSLIRRRVSIREAAKAIGCNESSLRARLKKGVGSTKLGRFRAVFSKEQEEELVRHCVALDKRFFGLTLKSLRYLLYSFATKNGVRHRFSEATKVAGRDFTRNFMLRNKLSLRVPRKTSVARMMGFNRTQLTQYFDNLEGAISKYGFTPDRIYNMDETGIQTVPNKLPKHVAPTGKREVSKSVAAEQGQTVSVACAMSVTGHFVPPFFIFARKRMNLLLIKAGPVGCDMAVTDKGYMNSPTFIKWLEHFKKHTNPSPDRPILLILDNHVSHVSLEAITFAKESNIHLLSLPPHSSHKTQPLDRNFFRPLKAFYDAAADDWNVGHPGQVFSLYEVAETFNVAFQKAATNENAVQGFRATGIFPLDRNKFTEADFLPSEVTDQGPHEEEEVEPKENRFIQFVENDNRIAINNHEPADAVEHQVDEELDASVENESTVAGLPAPTTPGVTNLLPGPSCSITPADIIPLPKLKITRKRTGRGLKSVLLTSTPNKERLEAQKLELANKERKKILKKAKPRKLFPKPLPKSRSQDSSSSDSETNFSLHNSSSDSNLTFSSEEEDDNDLMPPTNRNVQENDFAIVKVDGKTKNSFRRYIVKVATIHDDGFDGAFYKRAHNRSNRFVETSEEAFFLKEDILLKLTAPVNLQTARYQNSVTFKEDVTGVQ